MSLSKHEFTNAGRSMLGRAQAGETLTVTKIVVGSGVAGAPSDLWPLTALISFKLNVTISSKRDFGNGTLLVEGNFRSDDASVAFDLREVGVMAHIGAEADRLYSVANVFAETPVHIDPAAPVITAFKIKLIVDRIPSTSLVVQIGPSEAVTGENVGTDTIGPGFYKESIGNVQRFKRAAAGVGMVITEDVAENVITFSTKRLTANLDLYVPATYPGISDPDVLFPTIQAALDSVADLSIPTDKFVTIHVYSGNFVQTTTTVVDHPNASQIKIVGQDIVARSITGVITTTGTVPNNLDVTVNVSSNAGITVGDVVEIFEAPDGRLETCGYVTSLPAGKVVLRIHSFFAPPASISAGPSCKLLIFPTQYRSNVAGGLTLFSCKQGIGLIKNFALRSTETSNANASAGISQISGTGALENLAILGFNTGFGVRSGNLTITPTIVCSQCNVGAQIAYAASCTVQPPNVVGGWNRMIFTGNANYGVWISGGIYTPVGSATLTNAICNATGIRIDSGAFAHGQVGATTGGINVAFNDRGVVAILGGVLLCTSDSTNFIAANTTFDLLALQGGQITVVHNVNTTGKYSVDGVTLQTMPQPAVGPSGGYISVLSP
jgi:hypothetical protein